MCNNLYNMQYTSVRLVEPWGWENMSGRPSAKTCKPSSPPSIPSFLPVLPQAPPALLDWLPRYSIASSCKRAETGIRLPEGQPNRSRGHVEEAASGWGALCPAVSASCLSCLQAEQALMNKDEGFPMTWKEMLLGWRGKKEPVRAILCALFGENMMYMISLVTMNPANGHFCAHQDNYDQEEILQ